MQHGPPGQLLSEGAGPAPPRPRHLGAGAFVASLLAFLVGMAAWLGVLAALVYAVAFAFDGGRGLDDLIGSFDGFDPVRLRSDPGAQRALFALGAVVYLAALASLVTVARLFAGERAAEYLGWTGPWPRMSRAGWILVACAPLYHIAAGATLRYFFPDFALWLIPPRDVAALALSFAMIVILAPLTEELMFRGWMFGALRARLPAGATVLATAFLFAVVHWDATGLYPVAVLAPGFVLSVLRERTGSVKASVAGHAIYNFMGWLLLALAGLFLLK